MQDFGGETSGKKKTFGRPRRRWEDSIEMKLQGIGWVGVYWIGVAPDRDRWRALVSAVVKLRLT
jgi:hypothetical protein